MDVIKFVHEKAEVNDLTEALYVALKRGDNREMVRHLLGDCRVNVDALLAIYSFDNDEYRVLLQSERVRVRCDMKVSFPEYEDLVREGKRILKKMKTSDYVRRVFEYSDDLYRVTPHMDDPKVIILDRFVRAVCETT